MNTSIKQDPQQLRRLKKEIQKERLRRKMLLKQHRMQEALFVAIDNYWETMNEEERRTAIQLGHLAKDLEKNLKETFTQKTN